MNYGPEKVMQSLPTAARVQESSQNNPETGEQVLADFKEVSGEEESQAGTGDVDRRNVMGCIVALAAAGGVAGVVYAIASMNRWGGIGSGCDDDDDATC